MKIGRFIRARTITEAWYRGLNLIWRQGYEICDERDTKTREILDLQVMVEDPFKDMISDDYSWNQARLEEYARQLISGQNPGFEYTYGERLRSWAVPGAREPVDQIERLIGHLKSKPNTRRATAVTLIPPVDSAKAEIPCMIVDDFKIREGRLNLTAFFRSHDFAGAYPANLYGLSRLLKYVSEKTNTEPGSIVTLSASAHIYDHDWDWIEEMLLGRAGGDM
ncbi:MAG: thymidylate synthase [Methanotrichaceae archaeon]